MSAQPGLHQFHSDFGQTYIWGFNGKFPAPTLLNKYDKPTIVRFRNNLPATTTTFGRNEITIHLHNGHHGSESDGFAGDWFPIGFWKDNHYPNCYAGLDAFGGNGNPQEKMGSFWFHDHRAEFTLPNNVDRDRIKATFDRGLLGIEMPKSEEARPRQIKIGGGDGEKKETIDVKARNQS